MIRVVFNNSNESTYNQVIGYIVAIRNKNSHNRILTMCDNGLAINIDNPGLCECNIRLFMDKDAVLKYIKAYTALSNNPDIELMVGTLCSDTDLNNFIIRIDEGE